jgi:Kef-type K+ transport system membrane component KefB
MLATEDFMRALCALAVLLAAAGVVGAWCERLRQPRVIGEILGGLIVGPTVLGAIFPDAVAWLFPAEGEPVASILGAVSQLGLMLLLFCSGAEMRLRFNRSERRLVGVVSVTGVVLPFLVGLAFLQFVDLHKYWGAQGNRPSFVLIFATAIAVTSIPVISRIMSGLGILRTGFARVVLGVAIIEDVVLYAVLAIALSLAGGPSTAVFGLPDLLGLVPGSTADIAYHVVTTVAVLVGFLGGAGLIHRALSGHQRLLGGVGRTTRRVLFLLATSILCLFLGVQVFLAAFVAGVVVGQTGGASEPADKAKDANSSVAAIRRFSNAFFIPVYFALVGVSLNLRQPFDVWFFLGFLLLACVAKASSVYLGARLARAEPGHAANLAIALNARGGPGIVLATVAYGAEAISREFYVCLVLLAIVTSIIAGSWLQSRPREVFFDDADRDEAGAPTTGRDVAHG